MQNRFKPLPPPPPPPPPPTHTRSNLLLTFPRRCFCCGLFVLSMFVRFLFIYDFLSILLRIAWWPSCLERAVLLAFCSCCSYFMPSKLYVFLTYLVFRAGCGIRLYRFLIVAFLFTSYDRLHISLQNFSVWFT